MPRTIPRSRRRARKKATGSTVGQLFEGRGRVACALRRLCRRLADDRATTVAEISLFRAFERSFRAYSPFNALLIALQHPGAGFVCGRRQWEREHGRTVRKGARAIRILAPALDRGDDGRARGFRVVLVYDASDTEGEGPLVPPVCSSVEGQRERIDSLLGALEDWVRGSGLDLRYEHPSVNRLVDGWTDGRTIRVRPELEPPQRLAVLAHEIAHAKLHFSRGRRGRTTFSDAPDERPVGTDERELEAEVTACLLLALGGVDASGGAALYLATWSAKADDVARVALACVKVATGILQACRRKRYRRLVEAVGVASCDGDARRLGT